MRYGNMTCSCGQTFYFETAGTKVRCIRCGAEHDVGNYPIKPEDVTEETPTEE